MAEFLPPFFILRYLLTVIFPPIIEAALYTVEKVQLYRPFPPAAAEKAFLALQAFREAVQREGARAIRYAKENGCSAYNLSADLFWPLLGEYWVRDILGVLHMKLL